MRSDGRSTHRRRRWLSLWCAAILTAPALVAYPPSADEPDRERPSSTRAAPSTDVSHSGSAPPSTNAVGGLPQAERPKASGDYQKSATLEVPPYYAITPSLRLSYDSRAGDGWLGVGWRLDGLSAVQRLGPGQGVPTHTAADSYFMDGAELVRCETGTPGPSCAHQVGAPLVGYAARSDDYRRYAFDPRPVGGSWQVWQKDGTTYTYEPRAGQSSVPSAWDLTQVQDTSGHTVRYEYRTEDAQSGGSSSYPSRISYGGMSVDFYYQGRDDPVTYGDGRALVTSGNLLKAVDVKAGAKRVRVYQFQYRTHPDTGRSVLAEMRQFGTDTELNRAGEVVNAATASALPPTRFEQQESSRDAWGLTEVSDDQWGVPLDGNRPSGVLDGVAFTVTDPYERWQPSNLGDIDGNGRTDWVQVTADLDDSTDAHTRVLITAAVAGRAAPVYTQEELAWPYGKARIKTTLMGDIDADGRSDLVFVTRREPIPGGNPNHAAAYLGIAAARSTGNGHFTWMGSTLTETMWETRDATGNRVSHCLLGDVDGDARQDVICSFTRLDGTHHLGTATSIGDGSFAVREEPAPFAVQGETRLLAVGDTNGDGLYDPMFLDFPHCPASQPGCTVQYQLVTALSAGDHYAMFERQQTAWDRNGVPNFMSADINGDGKGDYVVFKTIAKPGDPGAIQTAYRGFEGRWIVTASVVPGQLTKFPPAVSIGDADGDNKDDLLLMSRQENGKPGCGTGFSGTHVNLHRVLSRGNGTFALPSSWEDCSRSRELDIDWADIGFTPVEPQAADLDGDHTADFLIAVAPEGDQFTTLRDDLTASSAVDVPNWRPAELNGDGRGDWVFIRNSTTGPLIASMIAKPGGGYVQRAHSPVPGTSRFTVQDGWRVGDLNADGTDDLVYLDYLTTQRGVNVGSWLSQTDGSWKQQTVPVLSGLDERHRNTLNWQLTDLNADGSSDLLYVDRSDTGAELATWSLLSKGDGTWTEVPEKALPQWGGDATNRRITDVNGDGRSDLQYIAATHNEINVHSAIGTGDGTWKASATNPATVPRKADDGVLATDRRSWSVGDVNADGLSDVFAISPTDRDPQEPFKIRVLTLLGHGDGGYTDSNGAQPDGLVTGDMLQWRMANVSNDHRADLVHVRTAPPGVVVTTLTYSHHGTWYLSSPDVNITQTTQTTVGNQFVVADIDGNGQDDLTRFDVLPQGMRLLSLSARFNRDVVTRVTSAQGAVTDIDYTTRAELSLGSATARCHVPVKVQPLVVRKISVRAGPGAAGGAATYDYTCPTWSYAHHTFLGWRSVIVQRPATAAQAAQTVQHRFRLSDACFAQTASTDVYDGQGALLTRKITSPLPAGDTAPYTCALTNYVDDITVNASGQAMNVYTYHRHDDYGNITEVSQYGADLAKNSDERTTTTLYRPAPGPYIVGLPYQQVLSEGTQPAGTGVRHTYFCYDGDNGTAQTSCAGTVTKGLLTAKKVVNPTGWYDTTLYHHDQYGNLDSITDPAGRQTTLTYDTTYHRLPEQICDPSAQCTTVGWDPGFSRTTSLTDADGVLTELTYDAFGRLRQVLPSGRAKTECAYLGFGDPGHQRVRIATDDGTADGLWSETYLDGLGRPYREIREGGEPGSKDVRDTVYVDAGSAVAQQSFWHAESAEPVLENYTYDALSRPTSHRHADGAQETWSYDNDTVRTSVHHTDEVGNLDTTHRDAYGRTVGSQQPTGTGTMETGYVHDAADQLKTIAEKPDSGGITTVDRDARGDVRSITNPDGGTVGLEDYDRTGRVRTIVDPNGGWTRLAYDKSGRLSGKTAPSYREMKVYYGEAGHGSATGQVTSVTDTQERGCPLKVGFGGYVTKELFYDSYGRIQETMQCVDGKTVRFAFTYDKLDRVRTMTYPDKETVTYDYDEAGRVKSVSGYADNIRYDAAGRVTALQLANNTTQTYHYDRERSWLDAIEVTRGGQTVFDLTYDRYPDGSVKATTSTTNQANFGYTYDRAGQLTDTTGNSPQQFQYDATGNRTTDSELGTYTYDAPSQGGAGCGDAASSIACPHAVKHVGAAELTYDKVGNLTSIANGSAAFPHLKSIAWNKDLQPITFTDDKGVQTKLRYDENGQRVYRNRAGQVSLYFAPYVDIDYTVGQPDQRSTQFYFVGDLLLAKKDASGRTWYHADETGSIRATTNAAGARVARFDYTPFGQPLGTTPVANAQDRRFAGHRIDPDNDLIYMGARYYSPSIGKFISPDPIIPGTFQPMAANRYAYAYNNPLSYVDPLGLDPDGLGISGHYTPQRDMMPDLIRVHGLLAQAQPPTSGGTTTGSTPTADTYRSQTSLSVKAAKSLLMPTIEFEITPLPPKTADEATYAGRLMTLLQKALAPLRVSGLAIGNVVEVNANGCGIFCFLVADVSAGYLVTPAGANDWFFGDIHLFGSVGGAVLGVTPGPKEAIDFLALDRPSGWQYSLGLSAGVGASAMGFVTEATTPEAFGAFSRNAGASIGPITGFRSENTAGQATYGIGLGFSKGWFIGGSVFNTYTVVSPGIWPSWLPVIPYR